MNLEIETYHLGSARVLQELWRERARMGQTAVRNLARENGLYHLAQACRFLDVAPFLCLVSKVVVHGATDGRTNSVATNNQIACGCSAIPEVERNGLCG